MNINSNNEIKINGSNNRVYIGSKEKFEPMVDWLKKVILLKVKSAGKRYAPNLSQYMTLNQKINISEIFSYIDNNFFVAKFNEYANGILAGKYNVNTKEDLINLICNIRSSLPKDIANDKERFNILQNDNPHNILRLEESWWNQLDDSARHGYCFMQAHQLKEMILKKEDLLSFLISPSTYFYERNILIITGEALIGKTHLFCDTALGRLQDNKPTLLFFGNNFSSDKAIISDMISNLGIINCSEDEFLEALDKLGAECGSKTLLMVDAINETKDSNIWQNGIIELCEKIKSYQNLALALSIRDIDRNKLETNNNEKYIADEIVEIEHKGFEGMELEAVQVFCNTLGVETPKVPMHSLRLFVNPGMLFLYIESIKKTTKKIDASIINPTTIFKTYLANLNKDFSQKYNLDEDDNTVSEAIEKFVSLGTKQDYSHFYIEQKVVSAELKKIHPEILKFLKSEGVINKLSYEEETKLYFTYQKFENFFIAEYLLKDYETHKATIIYLIKGYNGSISEALMVQLPEKIYKEIFELNIWFLRDRYICQEYLSSLIWRHPNTITEQTFKYIRFIYLHHNLISDYFDVVLQLSTFPNHPLNIKRLHKSLFKVSRSLREHDWSTHIHSSFQNSGIAKRIVKWAWDKGRLFEISDESLYLYGLTLSWFLMSSNRTLRDSATKALVNIFTDKIDVFLTVLKEFKNVDDLYITERLYAAAYGITLRSFRDAGMKELAEYVYCDIFDVENVVEHILIRDYARQTIEYIASKVLLNMDISKINPPYGSKMPQQVPSDAEIEELEQESFSNQYKRDITRSMITGWGRGKNSRYGDFGRYKFQSELSSFNLKKTMYQSLSNYAVKIIFEELIKDDKLFKETERRLNVMYVSRTAHNIERLGKKYQWIAFHKILAKVGDNFKVRDYSSWKMKYVKYKGAYQINVRDIDPTTILRNKKGLDDKWWSNIDDSFANKQLSDIEWMQSTDKLPSISDIVKLNKDRLFWVLNINFSKDSNQRVEKYRNLYYQINSFLVKKKDFSKLIAWAKSQNFYARIMPEARHFSEAYLREYPHGASYKFIDKSYYSQVDWSNYFDRRENEIPCKILLTSTAYFNEGQSYDKSTTESIEIALPNKWLINQMGLRQSQNDGEWINANNEVVFFDPTIFFGNVSKYDENGALVADKKLLLDFLNQNNLCIFWVLWGEKQIRNTEEKFNTNDFLGIAEISGFSYFDGTNIVDNEININFTPRK